MDETTKANQRRYMDLGFQSRYFSGRGIDIGCGAHALNSIGPSFTKITSVDPWDLEQGDAQYMEGVPDDSYDFVYSSHCLEHMHDPRMALAHWIRILKPGGHLIVSVPDEDLYEQGQWPSRLNHDHKHSFTVFKQQSHMPKSINVMDLVRDFDAQIDCERVCQLRDFLTPFDNGLDQTLGNAECAIEFVWRKKTNHTRFYLQQALELARQYRAPDAEGHFLLALQADPLNFDAYNAYAHFLICNKRYGEVEVLWERCVAALPTQHMPRIFQALHLIANEKFDRGFALRDPCVSDARRTPTPTPTRYPKWTGENLEGKSIVIWTEFGYGDEIMFARFASVLKKTLGAASVTLLCQGAVLPLLKTLAGVDSVIDESGIAALPDHDYWVFPHSIPVYFSLDKHGVPWPGPYVHADKGSAVAARHALKSQREHLRVGLVWKGNPTHENDAQRSLNGLYVLESLLAIPGIHFVSLQAGPAENDWSDFERRTPALSLCGNSLRDFGDTAAVIDQLDLIICVDTAVAHTAAAMGKPTWVMLPTYADWRWGLGNNRSAWYPAADLYRQCRPGDWAPVVQKIKQDLLVLVERYQGAFAAASA